MNLEANKLVVRALFARLGKGDVEGALRLVSDKVNWLMQGMGTFDKNGMRGNWGGLFAAVSGDGAVRVKEITAEEDRVAAEIEIGVKLPDGRDYRTAAHVLLVVREGKIGEAREYLDTAYTQKMFGAAPEARK